MELVEVIKLEKKSNKFVHFILQKLGKLKFRLHRKIGRATAAVKREPSVGTELRWILIEAEEKAIGIDLEVDNL